MATKYRLKRKYRIRLHNTTLSMIVLSLVIGLASFTLVNTSALEESWDIGANGSSVQAQLNSDRTLTITGTDGSSIKKLNDYNDQPWKDCRGDIKKVVIANEVTATDFSYYFCDLENLKSIEGMSNVKISQGGVILYI